MASEAVFMYWLFPPFPFYDVRFLPNSIWSLLSSVGKGVGGFSGECFVFLFFFGGIPSPSSVVPSCRACDWDGDGVGTSEWRVSPFSFWKSELFSSQCCCRFRQRILANLDPSRGLLIGSRELLWKLCPIEMRLLPRWYHLLFSSYKLFIGDFLFFSLPSGPVDSTVDNI